MLKPIFHTKQLSYSCLAAINRSKRPDYQYDVLSCPDPPSQFRILNPSPQFHVRDPSCQPDAFD
jgi:hypothetical protein